MNKTLSYAFLAGFILVVGQPAFSWGDLGHETVGEIAERNLSSKGKKFIRKIIGIEPLSTAATWPDKVRSDPRFAGYDKFSSYHFNEIPFGYTFDTIPSMLRVKRSAHTMLSKVPRLLMDPNVDNSIRQIWFRYFVHIVGDVHQPLHVGNGWDLGGNLCSAYWKPYENSTPLKKNLHSIWDSEIPEDFRKDWKETTGGKGWFGYYQLADLLAEAQKDIDEDIVNLPVEAWYAESVNEHKSIYPDETEVVHPKDRVYCKYKDLETKEFHSENFDETKIPTLDRKYIDAAKVLVKRKIILGGLRLAAQLNEMARRAPAELLSNKRESTLLQKAQLEN